MRWVPVAIACWLAALVAAFVGPQGSGATLVGLMLAACGALALRRAAALVALRNERSDSAL